MNRRAFITGVSAMLAAPLAVEAQSEGGMAHIGILREGSPPDPLVEAFKQGLQELGYVEGRTITIDYRWAEGREERLAPLATELVARKVDVIVAGGVAPAKAARHATRTIPIVVPVMTDPVEAGLASSLAHPGGNITGLAPQTEEMTGKWVGLLREALPRLSRVAALWDPGTARGQLTASESAARALGIQLQALTAGRFDDLNNAFSEAQKKHSEALLVLGSAFFFAYRARLVELAAQYRMPTMYQSREFVVGSGGLISYGPDIADMHRRASGYVSKILKGAKPSDLPIEQPTKFELVINLKTAKALGLTIPQSVLVRADEIIQ